MPDAAIRRAPGHAGVTLPRPPLGDEQRAVLDRVADLARTHFAGRAASYDAESAFPYENYRDLHDAGVRLAIVNLPDLADTGPVERFGEVISTFA